MSTKPNNTANSTIIAIITDIHYGSPSTLTQRRTDIADILLLRVVHRLNRYIKPDVTVVLGDILDEGNSPASAARLKHIHGILDKLEAHLIVIPGNHDGDIEDFYRNFPRPTAIEKVGDICFIPFIDRDAPGHNATRSPEDIGRFRQVRSECDGLVVALQHVCLHPEGLADIPYNYTNAESIISEMQRAGVTLSLSGHYHKGAELIKHKGIHFVNAPGLCEHPFQFTVVHVDNQAVTMKNHQLAMPKSLHLVDNHVHTELAYCQENMTVERAISFSEAVGLRGIGFAEHSGQLYFPSDQYWGGACYLSGIESAKPEHDRIAQYLQLKEKYNDNNVRFGLEVDIDYKGRLLLKDADRIEMDYVIGSVHSTPNIKTPGVPQSQLADEFMALLEKLLRHDVGAIAHPFRVFRRAGLTAPEFLYEPVADLLAKYETAAEINYHINEPPLLFIIACLERDVKFTLGSDAHNLYEVGDFTPNLQLLKTAGYDGDLGDILLAL